MEGKFQIHLFTSENRIENETFWLRIFFTAGLDCLHLRKPGFSREEYQALIEALPEKFHQRIILHDYPELAEKYGCGFQLNKRNPAIDFTPSVLSKSCHSREEAIEALEIEKCNFVTLSPFFNSISKQGYIANSNLFKITGLGTKNIVALGGITLESLPLIEDKGFGGAALLGDVWIKPGGCERFLKYLRMRNVSFQFITNGTDATSTINQALRFIENGGRWIQVRMKNSTAEEIKNVLKVLKPVCENMGATLIVDDHYELLDYCHGVHLGQNDESVEFVRTLATEEKIIGLTVNNESQIEASKCSLPDYYGVGPFRYTATKERLAPILGIEGYRKLAPLIPRPFVAIGGIKTDDLPILRENGVRGIAMSSAILKSENIKESINYIKDILNEK